jgi:hypothetical protein
MRDVKGVEIPGVGAVGNLKVSQEEGRVSRVETVCEQEKWSAMTGSSTQMDTKPTHLRKSLQRDVLKRKKMAASRAGEVKFVRWKVGGERRHGAFWHARCTYPGIGPRTQRFPGGNGAKRRWRDYTRSQ